MDINYEIGHQYALCGEYKAAYFHLKKSMKQGHPGAANDIGVMLERNKKYTEAIQAYKKAIKLGSYTAYYNVGFLYENGLGTRQDFKKAKEYYLKAINYQHPLGYYKLAKFYMYGLGVRKNTKKAFEYLTKGAEIEKESDYYYTDCTCSMAFHYFNGYGVEKDQKKAFELWDISAKNGDINGRYHVALSLLDGEIVERNFESAFKHLVRLAVNNQYTEAMLALAKIFERGEDVGRDYEEAGRWLLEAADFGNPDAYLKIACICLDNNEELYGFKKDFTNKAIVDFLSHTLGKEKIYSGEYKIYKKLKARYPDQVDWAYLETMPDLSKIEEEQPEVCSC